MTPFKKSRPAFNPFLIPLTTEQHAALSNPPAMAYLALKEERATRQDLWNLWFRARCTLGIVEKYHVEVVEEVRPIVEKLEAFFLDLHAHPHKAIEMDLADRSDLGALLELADEVQKETNRMYQLNVYKAQRQYCLDAVQTVRRVDQQPVRQAA